MRKLLLCTAPALLVGQAVRATPVLFLKSGMTGMEVTGSGNTVTLTNVSLGGWFVTRILGSSNSPTTNPGLSLTSVGAECSVGPFTCAMNPLNVFLSETDFTTTGAFESTYILGPEIGGTTTQINYFGRQNILFQSSGGEGPPTVGVGLMISFLGPFGEGSMGGSQMSVLGAGPPPAGFPPPYSLTIQDVFTVIDGNFTEFGTNVGSVSGVPEPSSFVTLGGGLLWFCLSRLRRRKA